MQDNIKKIVEKARAGALITPEEIATLLNVPLMSEESFYIQYAARQMSEEVAGKAEVHGQVGVNCGPCPKNCAFCSFAVSNKVFPRQQVEDMDKIIEQAQSLEKSGANAVYLMATATMKLDEFIKIGKVVHAELDPETILVANIGDFDYQGGLALKEAGFAGIYHAVRLGEGQVTQLEVKERLATFRAAKEVGLKLGTCLEPVGPEHTIEELIEKILILREAKPVFGGSARRIPIPDTVLAPYGITSEARMGLILGVVRLAMGKEIPGNCTHEPNVHGAVVGASLLWAEAGPNPRDTVEHTETSRGFDVTKCQTIFEEAEWPILDGPSRFFGN